jgi:hypothetical protein
VNDYDDIIHLPHHQSTKHPQMSPADRAAQFSPFAALTGYHAAVQEAGRLTDRKVDLTEDEKAALDEKIRLLLDRLGEQPEIAVTYFLPDLKKDGGSYQTVSGQLKKVDFVERILVFAEETAIPMDDVVDIESPLFQAE